MREKDFLATVITLLERFGWLAYHTHDSRRSVPGFPDIVALRQGRLLALELKMPNGRVSKAQQHWLEEFDKVPGAIAAVVWWQQDLEQLVEVIR